MLDKGAMNLRSYRLKLGISQETAAFQAKISPAAFHTAETGSRYPMPETILKIMAWSKKRVREADILRGWCAKQGEKYTGAR